MADAGRKSLVEYRPGFFLTRRVPTTDPAIKRAVREAMANARAAARRLRES